MSLPADVRSLFGKTLAAEKERGELYLANHSLGRMPDAAAENVQCGMQQWATRMDSAWDEGGWMDEVWKFRELIAGLLGFARPDCVVPKVSAGQGLRAVLNAHSLDLPISVVTTSGEFDSVDFILRAYRKAKRATVQSVTPTRHEGPVPIFTPDSIMDAIRPGTDLVVVSAVMFGTGQVLPALAHIVHQVHTYGALVMVDCYHSLGVLPIDFKALNVDFVIGGCYKYLRGGPGAGFLAINPRVLDREEFRTRDTGWFAKADKFAYARPEPMQYAPGGDAWMESTPAVLTAYQATPGLSLVDDWGVAEIRADNLAKQVVLREVLEKKGYKVFNPANPDEWGAFTLLHHADARHLAERFKQSGVNCDARGEFVRFCPDVLTEPDEFDRIPAGLADH